MGVLARSIDFGLSRAADHGPTGPLCVPVRPSPLASKVATWTDIASATGSMLAASYARKILRCICLRRIALPTNIAMADTQLPTVWGI